MLIVIIIFSTTLKLRYSNVVQAPLFLGSENVILKFSSKLATKVAFGAGQDVTLCQGATSIPRGIQTLCCRVTGITDLTLSLRYHVANDQLDVNLVTLLPLEL